MSDTYGTLHAGDIVRGESDGRGWTVARIEHAPRLVVTLAREGVAVVGMPPGDMPVVVLQRRDVAEEFRAAALLIEAFGPIEILSEEWAG